jgi:hypothetical protein
MQKDKEIIITFWDIPRNTNLKSIFRIIYHFTNAILYVFDLISSVTFDVIDEGMRFIKNYIQPIIVQF